MAQKYYFFASPINLNLVDKEVKNKNCSFCEAKVKKVKRMSNKVIKTNSKSRSIKALRVATCRVAGFIF